MINIFRRADNCSSEFSYYMPISQADLSNIKFFKDESIITEEAYGIKIDQSSGAWSKGQFEDTKEYMKKFQKFE